MSAPSTRQPFAGRERKLVLAFDIGTTFSGVSYALLEPGVVPEIEGITRFPAQQKVGGDSKIPSVVCYGKSGELLAVGEEAAQYQEATEDDGDDENEEDEWNSISGISRVEWFKLHFRPDLLPTGTRLPPLPAGKSAWQVYADFLTYLFTCAKTFIQQSRPTLSWESLGENIEFILTHPNGWEGPQQAQMRRATVSAGLVPEASADSRVHFVSEGEASLNFCVNKGIMTDDLLPAGDGCIIVDAGGGTVDISAYSKDGGKIREIAASECCMEGSVMVTRRAGSWLTSNLRSSKYGNPQDVAQMMAIFDKTTKISFRNSSEPSYIRFGRAMDKDIRYDIRAGQKKIPGATVASFFQPGIDSVVDAVLKQKRQSSSPIKHVFLVGGFAASDWLFGELQSRLASHGLQLSRPDGHVNKAVADGAISYHVDHHVSTRVARFTYGVECSTPYLRWHAEHKKRKNQAYTNLAGAQVLPKHFSTILSKGSEVSETKEFFRPYQSLSGTTGDLGLIHVQVLCYKGEKSNITWVDEDAGPMETSCRVVADASALARTLEQRENSDGSLFYSLQFDVVLLFGLTELKAEVRWNHQGFEHRSPASVVYDSDI